MFLQLTDLASHRIKKKLSNKIYHSKLSILFQSAHIYRHIALKMSYKFCVRQWILKLISYNKFEPNRTANSIKFGNFEIKICLKSNISLPIHSISPYYFASNLRFHFMLGISTHIAPNVIFIQHKKLASIANLAFQIADF